MTPRDERAASLVPAAGALLWRRQAGQLQVLLVHRAKYDDWSWPKGKLDPGETWVGAAAREVQEETGLRPRLGPALPESVYALPRGGRKHVRYWAGRVVDGDGRLEHEIDQVAWLAPQEARARLTQPRNADQLQALLEADARGELDTWPLLVVRHADAGKRADWPGVDADRPLSALGTARAHAIVPILRAFDVRTTVTSPSERCLRTVLPYATAAQVPLRTKKGLSEEGHADDRSKVVTHVGRLLDAGAPAALCTHRPLLPTLLHTLAEHGAPGSQVEQDLARSGTHGMEKGEVLACQVRGRGPGAQVVSVQRFRPSVPGS